MWIGADDRRWGWTDGAGAAGELNSVIDAVRIPSSAITS
ncbi:hypothetical protein T261_2259 [Streptomyces lydicus]|nr:hypothetical protein T261_2259 [Streptomyces lydicus]